MRKSKQNKKKKKAGTNLKTSPLKTYKKQVKRMKNNISKINNNVDTTQDVVFAELKAKYQTRLDGAELFLKNWDSLQQQKKADAMTAAIKAKQ
jgi:hypothetical protein